ncbi:MAG TPA: NAD(P)H-binding protein [Bauldia sp.]
MKIALIGASGRVGQAILAEALERGHTVTAIARNAAKLTAAPPLKTVDADGADVAQTAAAVKGGDAVISAFNSGWTNPNIRADFAKGMEGIIAGVKQAGVKRILFLGGAGVSPRKVRGWSIIRRSTRPTRRVR